MRIHIMGICGTFMGGLAIMARQMGYEVTGSDQNVYPPMSTQLKEQGIALMSGYSAENLDHKPDVVVVGNAISRGNPEMEAVLNLDLPYVSGPQWLADHVLRGHWVLGVSGTHGKTTTSSMLAWILEATGLEPGFLIGGIPLNFGISARIGGGRYFVVEADEYDTAFFDKRSKFVHYRPKTLIMNNLEFDHADIFPDLAAIQKQFHHLVRTVPGEGRLVVPREDMAIKAVLAQGCWTPVETVGDDQGSDDSKWQYHLEKPDGSRFLVLNGGFEVGCVDWALTGLHNVHNGLAAIVAAEHIGISPAVSARSLCDFQNVKRRMEVRAEVDGITLYDDFAHHPTAIETTLNGLRARVGTARIIAVLEPRSNTMKMGIHADLLGPSLASADLSLIFQAEDLGWDIESTVGRGDRVKVFSAIDPMVELLKAICRSGDHVVFMSNGGFGSIHEKTEQALSALRNI